MVHCVKCGTENPDTAQYCTKCGARLYVTGPSEHYRRMEGACFGLPWSTFWIIIGILIIVSGITAYLSAYYPEYGNISSWLWPIIVGTIIIIVALIAMQRRGRR